MSITDSLLLGDFSIQEWVLGNKPPSLLLRATIGNKLRFDGSKAVSISTGRVVFKYRVVPSYQLAIDLLGENTNEKVNGIVIPRENGSQLVFPINENAARPTVKKFRDSPDLYWSIVLSKIK